MINAPLFVVVLVITLIALKTRAARAGSTVLGLVLGLTLASTSLGRPVMSAVTQISQGLVSAFSSLGAA